MNKPLSDNKDSIRVAFEAWVRDTPDCDDRFDLSRNSINDYIEVETRCAWRGFLAACRAPHVATAITAQPAGASAEHQWAIAEFWSSASPGTKVRMLAEGAPEIEQWGKRGDFIRWVAQSHPLATSADKTSELTDEQCIDIKAPSRDGRMSNSMRDYITGMSVSMDVSTGEHDALNRYFGVVSEVMDDLNDKHGVTLLVYDATPNFVPSVEEVRNQVLDDVANKLASLDDHIWANTCGHLVRGMKRTNKKNSA